MLYLHIIGFFLYSSNVCYCSIANVQALQSTTKRDELRHIEREVQQQWEKDKVFEVDAPEVS